MSVLGQHICHEWRVFALLFIIYIHICVRAVADVHEPTDTNVNVPGQFVRDRVLTDKFVGYNSTT